MKHKYSTWLLAFLFVAGVIVIYKTVDNFTFIFDYIGKIASALSPFITGFVIAYLLNLPIKRFQELVQKAKPTFFKKHSKGIAIAVIYLLALLAIIVVIRLIAPAIYNNLYDLYINRNVYLNLMVQKLADIEQQLGVEIFDKQKALSSLQNYFKNIRLSEFGKYALGVVNMTSGVIGSFIAVIISVYMLADKQVISASVKRALNAFLPSDKVSGFIELCARINFIFSKYILSLLFDALAVGVISTIIMSLLRVKYAMVLGLMMGVFNLIPYFGAIVAVAVSVIITLLTGGWFQALWVGIALILFQQIDSNFIGPRIMGNMLEARPLLIIFAVTLGGGLFGLSGMILSVPIVVVIKMLLSELIASQEAKKGVKNE